ncbi:ABC transporter ATP-binding protein [Halorubrum gandharaense]
MSDDTSDPLVEVEDLRTYYYSSGLFAGDPVKAVDGVSLSIERGETLGIVGESGCGKTTLARSILQLEDVTEGRVTYAGEDVTEYDRAELKDWRRNAQIVYQNPTSSINERMTVGEVIREPLDAHDKLEPDERREHVLELLDVVGLKEEHYYRYPHQFSGGQRQRVGIARALALEPDFIVLDEPVSALDVSVQAKILNLLKRLQNEYDLTYLLIAHDLSVVRHVCDRVAVMYLGKVMEQAPTAQLFKAPQNPYTRALLSAIPQPDPDADHGRVSLHGTPPSPRNPPSGCVFSTRCPVVIRPEGGPDLDDAAWERVDEFREVVRDRATTDPSPIERIKGVLGFETRFTPIEEVADELFADEELPESAAATIDTATNLVAEGNPSDATTELSAVFAGVCEKEAPSLHATEAGSVSRCHRHREAYADPESAESTESVNADRQT